MWARCRRFLPWSESIANLGYNREIGGYFGPANAVAAPEFEDFLGLVVERQPAHIAVDVLPSSCCLQGPVRTIMAREDLACRRKPGRVVLARSGLTHPLLNMQGQRLTGAISRDPTSDWDRFRAALTSRSSTERSC